MSQAGTVNEGSAVIPGTVAENFVTQSGTAIPVANTLNVLGSGGLFTSGSGNTVTYALQPNHGITDWDDFLALASGTGASKLGFQSGSSGGITQVTGTATNPGQITWNSVAPGVDDSVVLGSEPDSPFGLGAGTLSINWVINLVTLGNVTNNYTSYVGLMNGGAFSTGIVIEPTDGCYFKYNYNINGGNWQILTANSSTRTTTNTTTAGATGFVNFGIQINAAATSVSYTINGTVVGTIATNIPVVDLTVGWGSHNIAGSLPLQLTDLFYYNQVLTTAR